MTTDLTSDFCSLLADRIRASNRAISAAWLARLRELLPVGLNDIFPTDDVLDHIPALIAEIAAYVAAEAPDAAAANTAIQSKAHELGELRFAQQASVHQLLREYRLLGSVIGGFVSEQVDDLGLNATAADAVLALTRLNEALFVLLQMTVDTFVGRYAERIEEQTTRLEGFNRMVTHELRQPLMNLQLAVELLGSDAALHDAAKRSQFADAARRNVERLGDLVRTLGTLVRPEHDNPQVQTVDLGKLVAGAFRQVEEVAQGKGVALRNRVDGATMAVDVSRLELVLVNLLSNGIKYRDPGKGESFVEVAATQQDGAIRLEVRDNGLGIRREDHDRVFKRFVRAHADRDGDLGADGLGLGLAIVAECVKAMKGTIRLESSEGAGSTFLITLPDMPAARPPASA
jgi:signal transduction histidine kinase